MTKNPADHDTPAESVLGTPPSQQPDSRPRYVIYRTPSGACITRRFDEVTPQDEPELDS